MTTEDRIREFIISKMDWTGTPEELTVDYPLIERDVVDSMGIHHVVGFLESEFGIEVFDSDLVSDNFATIGNIGRLVESRI